MKILTSKFPSLVLILSLLALLLAGCSSEEERIYQQACRQMNSGNYAEAIAQLESIPEYADSAELIGACHYNLASTAYEAEDYQTAYDYLTLAGDYQDAAEQAQYMLYLMGHEAFLQGDYDEADIFFAQLTGSQEDHGYPHFRNLSEAYSYLREQRRNLSNSISFHINAESDPQFYDTLDNVFPSRYFSYGYSEDDQLLVIKDVHYAPSDKILWAIQTGKTSHLNADEIRTMGLATRIVEEATAASSDPYDLSLWIHNWICDNVSYYSPDMDVPKQEFIHLRELTCVGAMIDGKANCQGYADAFFLLGTMAGLDVDKLQGDAEGPHMWNTITLDGTQYLVDTTYDDLDSEELSGYNYTFFNTYWDPDSHKPYGDLSIVTLTTEPDLSQTYFAQNDIIFTNLEEAADHLVRDFEREGHRWTYAVIQGQTDISDQEIDDAVSTKLWKYFKYSKTYSWTWWTETYGGNTYITVYWVE